MCFKPLANKGLGKYFVSECCELFGELRNDVLMYYTCISVLGLHVLQSYTIKTNIVLLFCWFCSLMFSDMKRILYMKTNVFCTITMFLVQLLVQRISAITWMCILQDFS